MPRQFLPISALLLGSAFLLFAGGINALILAVRGGQEGFSAISLGLLGTGWATGYMLGCYFTPRLVARVGHIRSFSVMSALAAVALLLSSLLVSPWAWVPFRAVTGFCFAGAAMIVESWLSDRVDARSRGVVFGVYTMVNLVATTGGQLSLTLGDTTGFLFFAVGTIFYCLALIPTAVSSSASPQPLVSVRINLASLWENSPVAVFAALLIGISNGTFGTLAPVYAERVGLSLNLVALFASIPILAGALAQIPVGILSDRMDRRKVLIGLAIVAIAAEILFIIYQPSDRVLNLVLSGVFGAAIFAMYPVILAHANDHGAPGTAIQISGGLLMVFGFGTVFGPLAAGFGMSIIGPSGMFWTSIAAHIMLIAFTCWRIKVQPPLAPEVKGAFVMTTPARPATPETPVLAMGEEPRPGR